MIRCGSRDMLYASTTGNRISGSGEVGPKVSPESTVNIACRNGIVIENTGCLIPTMRALLPQEREVILDDRVRCQ